MTVTRSGRKVIFAVAPAFARAFMSVVAERDALKREVESTQQSLRELLDDVHELRAAVLARQRAEADLRDLYRERAIARARAAQRDPNAAT